MRASLFVAAAAAAAIPAAAAVPEWQARRAAAPGDAHDARVRGGGACNAATDCMLSGECVAGACVCYKPWTGATCGLLAQGAVAPLAQNGYGTNGTSSEDQVVSWGGNIIYYGGLWHLFVAEMINGCGLNDWFTNSVVSHAISSSPTGPFSFAGRALDCFAHNPQTSYIKGGGENGADLWAIWHIGDAVSCQAKNCSGRSDGSRGSGGASYTRDARAVAAAAGSSLHVASSPYGPWEPVAAMHGENCNNPTQMRHTNGTWFLLCDSHQLFRGPTIAGPWTAVMTVPSGGTPGTFEDGFLYQDVRGNWHVLYHTYTTNGNCGDCYPTSISGHSFSADGTTWFKADVQPYFDSVNVTDGSTLVMSTRERPKLLFDPASGEPTHLVNGICPTPNCPPQPAIECKNLFWDKTLVTPLLWQ